MLVCKTQRLRLRWITDDDAAFLVALFNEPDWIKYIGDRNVHSLEDARAYIAKKLHPSYEKDGYGFFLVETLASQTPVGISGFFQRDGLDAPDVGFAFLSEHCHQGYAFEATQACLEVAKGTFKIERMLAITQANNPASIRLLEKLGLVFEKMIELDSEELQLFAAKL
ncbi:MAG: RimJ/RimL family protein N-acetyltransferase [Candidatus Krumholzibacteriia bacterium]|jgi:RimJ/RimL family protein N-acetyltransferase